MLKSKIDGGDFIYNPPSLEEGIKYGEINCNHYLKTKFFRLNYTTCIIRGGKK